MRSAGYFFPVILVIVIGFGVFFRVEGADFLWDRTKSFPEVLLFVTRDAQMGMEMGRYYLDDGAAEGVYDIDRAAWLFERAVAIDELVPEGYYQLARIAFLNSRYNEALGYLEKHITLHPDADPRVFYLKGLVQAFAGNTEQALKTFEFYYTFDKTSWYIHNNLAWVHFQLGDYEAVDRISAIGLEYNPGNPWLLMDRAVAQFNLGETNRAIELLNEAERSSEEETETSWLTHYPGNDPQIAKLGLQEFRETLMYNKKLFHTPR